MDVLVRVPQRNQEQQDDTYISYILEDNLERFIIGYFVHAIMKAKKSHNLPSVIWRPRKSSDVIQSKSKGLRTRDVNVVDSSLNLKA